MIGLVTEPSNQDQGAHNLPHSHQLDSLAKKSAAVVQLRCAATFTPC